MKQFIIKGYEPHEWALRLTTNKSYAATVLKLYGLTSNGKSDSPVLTELWYNGGVVAILHSFIDSTLMEGDVGPDVWGMGATVIVGSPTNRLFKEGLGKLLPALKKTKFKGLIGLSTHIHNDQLLSSNFTSDINYNTIHATLELYNGYHENFVTATEEATFKAGMAVEIKLCIPPFPYVTGNDIKKEVRGINKYNLKHLWLCGVRKEGGKYFYEGDSGVLGAVTARGDSIGEWSPIRDARRRALRTISNLGVDDLMYRRDIGKLAESKFKKLVEGGWL